MLGLPEPLTAECLFGWHAALVGHCSGLYRTEFRGIPDRIPFHIGHHSNGAPKLPDISPENYPNGIESVSTLNRNTVRPKWDWASAIAWNTYLLAVRIIVNSLPDAEALDISIPPRNSGRLDQELPPSLPGSGKSNLSRLPIGFNLESCPKSVNGYVL